MLMISPQENITENFFANDVCRPAASVEQASAAFDKEDGIVQAMIDKFGVPAIAGASVMGTQPETLVPGSDRWNMLAGIHFQAKHMASSDAIRFLDKHVI